jgi:hypothetical protein
MVSVAAEGLEEGAAVGAGKVVMEAEEMAVEAEEAIEVEVMVAGAEVAGLGAAEAELTGMVTAGVVLEEVSAAGAMFAEVGVGVREVGGLEVKED